MEFQLRGQFNPLSDMVGEAGRVNVIAHRCIELARSRPNRALLEPASCFPQVDDLVDPFHRRFAPQFLKKGSGNAQVSNRETTTWIYERVNVLARLLQAAWHSTETLGLVAGQ